MAAPSISSEHVIQTLSENSFPNLPVLFNKCPIIVDHSIQEKRLSLNWSSNWNGTKQESYSLNTLANLLAWFPVYCSTGHPSALKWVKRNPYNCSGSFSHSVFCSFQSELYKRFPRNSGCGLTWRWKHWVSKRSGNHVFYGTLQEPCLKLLPWPCCSSLSKPICFPTPAPPCTVIKLSSCLLRDAQWLPVTYSLTSAWHSFWWPACLILGYLTTHHSVQRHWSLSMTHTFSPYNFACAHPWPPCCSLPLGLPSQNPSGSAQIISPGKFFLITLIRITCLPYAPGTLGLCLCFYTDSELTPVTVRRKHPVKVGTTSGRAYTLRA